MPGAGNASSAHVPSCNGTTPNSITLQRNEQAQPEGVRPRALASRGQARRAAEAGRIEEGWRLGEAASLGQVAPVGPVAPI